jgi:hypothetical protein
MCSGLGWCGMGIRYRLSIVRQAVERAILVCLVRCLCMLLWPRRGLAITLLIGISSGRLELIALVVTLRRCIRLRGRLTWGL